MTTKAEIIARIQTETRIISKTLISDYDAVRTYSIRHERARNVNAQGRTVTLWVYDEGGAGEEALMDYDQWIDVPLSVRLSDYIDTLPTTINVRNIVYLTAYIIRFTETTNTGVKTEKVGIWNDSTDKLDVYETTDTFPPSVKPTLPSGYFCFGQGYRNTAIPINPQDGKANAIKVPFIELKGIEQPQGINFVDPVNSQIVIPEGFELVRVDIILNMEVVGATGGSGTNFFGQWQRNGEWIYIEYETGFVKGDTVRLSLTEIAMLEDIPEGITTYDFWMWTDGRQGDVTLRDCTVVVTEIHYDPTLSI